MTLLNVEAVPSSWPSSCFTILILIVTHHHCTSLLPIGLTIDLSDMSLNEFRFLLLVLAISTIVSWQHEATSKTHETTTSSTDACCCTQTHSHFWKTATWFFSSDYYATQRNGTHCFGLYPGRHFWSFLVRLKVFDWLDSDMSIPYVLSK